MSRKPRLSVTQVTFPIRRVPVTTMLWQPGCPDIARSYATRGFDQCG